MDKVFIIAEAGVNHNGDLDMAVELVHHASAAVCGTLSCFRHSVPMNW